MDRQNFFFFFFWPAPKKVCPITGLNIHGLNGVYVRFVSQWIVGVIGVAL